MAITLIIRDANPYGYEVRDQIGALCTRSVPSYAEALAAIEAAKQVVVGFNREALIIGDGFNIRSTIPGTGARSAAEWSHLIRSCTSGLSPAQVVEVAQVCIEQDCGVWHACSVVLGHLERCNCTPCREARKVSA